MSERGATMSKIEVFENRPAVLGINGLGRIGKLTLWHHIGRKYFKEIVVNQGREVGTEPPRRRPVDRKGCDVRAPSPVPVRSEGGARLSKWLMTRRASF